MKSHYLSFVIICVFTVLILFLWKNKFVSLDVQVTGNVVEQKLRMPTNIPTEKLTSPRNIPTEKMTSSTNIPTKTTTPTVLPRPLDHQSLPHLIDYPIHRLPNYPLALFNSGTSKGHMKIATHGREDLISNYLFLYHTWEAGRIQMMKTVLTTYPELQLVDIGCNLGVFTMTAAAMGRQVVAIDSNIENAKRLRKSLLLNDLQDQVQIVYNAVSNDHYFIQMLLIPDNVGGAPMVSAGKNANSIYKKNSIYVPTITMDDLLTVTNFTRCMIKIDIEGSEGFAIRGSLMFFKKMDVHLIMMEWNVMKSKPEDAAWMIKYLSDLGFKACNDIFGKEVLQGHYSQWPYDIVWVKSK